MHQAPPQEGVVVRVTDLGRVLAEDPAAQDVLDTLSSSSAQRFVLSVDGAKTDETRRRPKAKAVATLREERH